MSPLQSSRITTRLTVITLAIALLLILPGCGKSAAVPAPPTPPSPITAKPTMQIHQAVATGNLKEVESNLDWGADPNVRNRAEHTPLHIAVRNDKYEICKYLIAHGSDVNVSDEDGQSPLHVASRNGNRQMATLLIESGADIEAKNNKGNTPLHEAMVQDSSLMASLFLEKGSDVNSLTIFRRDAQIPTADRQGMRTALAVEIGVSTYAELARS